jgi:transposase
MDRDVLKRHLDEGLSRPQIGALLDRDPSTVGYWVRKHGLVANGRAKYAPRGGLSRELLEQLAADGATLQEMADATRVSVSTVRHWLRKFDLRTANARGPRPRADAARAAGIRRIELDCRRHGPTTFILRSNGTWRCMQCGKEAVVRWRQQKKLRLVADAGGCCALCGYARYVGALHFHHLDPSTKAFSLSRHGVTRSLAEARAEAEKCVLLCANCHAEVEGGVASLP